MLTKILERVTRRREQKSLTTTSDVRQAIILAREAENGAEVELDDEHFAAIVEQAGLSDADLAATEAVYARRIEAAPLAARAKKLSDAAEVAEAAWRLADEREGARRRKALQEIENLNLTMRQTLAEHARAVAAENLLRDTAATSDEERELSRRLVSIAKEEQSLQDKLSPRMHPSTPAFYQPSVRENPGAVVAFAQREIEELSKRSDQQARAEIEKLRERIRLAEQAVAGLERELAALAKEREQINARLRTLSDEKLLPENFRIVKAKPDVDERKKDHAKEMGFGRPAFEPITTGEHARW